MERNLLSLGLLRNGKVYANKELAAQALTQVATNDGVAKLARYLYSELGGQPIIRTLVGFYANADEMEDNGGGRSYYTIFDIEGTSSEIEEVKQEVNEINSIIGEGIDSTTLTDAINNINDRLGDGFTSDNTVANALTELKNELTAALTVTMTESAGEGNILKVYTLYQGNSVIGSINIPKDFVVESGSLVHGTWNGDTFTEDPAGTDTAIKLVITNQAEPIYINTKDLVDYYTAGDGIEIDNDSNIVSVKIDGSSEAFLTVSANGLKLDGIQAAIEAVADRERLSASDGISISSNQVKAVAAAYSAESVVNPISVDSDGIKFASILDCGYFDS